MLPQGLRARTGTELWLTHTSGPVVSHNFEFAFHTRLHPFPGLSCGEHATLRPRGLCAAPIMPTPASRRTHCVGAHRCMAEPGP